MLHERLSFRCFGNDPPELRSDTQALYLTNEYPHPIRFTMLEIPKPFVIMNTRKGVVKPVGSQKSVQRMSIFDGDGPTYELESGRTLQFNITFQPAVDECKLNPPDVIFDVHIRLYFTDRHDQVRTHTHQTRRLEFNQTRHNSRSCTHVQAQLFTFFSCGKGNVQTGWVEDQVEL